MYLFDYVHLTYYNLFSVTMTIKTKLFATQKKITVGALSKNYFDFLHIIKLITTFSFLTFELTYIGPGFRPEDRWSLPLHDSALICLLQ